MKQAVLKKTINVLKVLLTIEDPETIKCTIESLIEDLEDELFKKDKK